MTDGPPAALRLVAPLHVEASALRHGLRRARAASTRADGAVASRWAARSLSRAGHPDAVTVLRSGAGSRARLVPGTGPVAVLGVAGSLDSAVRPGDVVVGAAVTSADGSRTLELPSAPLLAAEIRRAGWRVHLMPIATSPRVVTGAAARSRLAGTTGAGAVDMESLPLLAAAGDVPLAAVRVVVDGPADPLVHPGTLVRGVRALSRLAELVPAVLRWSAASCLEQVLLAEPRSFCAGVERAIATVEKAIDRTDGPVFVRRQVVHNAHVVAGLAERGAVFITELDEAPEGATVVLSAHGVSPAVRTDADLRGLQVIDATCPLVAKVHAEARHAAARGDTTVLIGHADHEEVVGTVGEAPGSTVVVSSAEEAEALQLADGGVTWLAQTTLAVDETEDILAVLQRRFPGGHGQAASDICYATTNRQAALRQIAGASDVVLVVGSHNSSNSRRLVEVAERAGTPAHLVEDVASIELSMLAGARRVGVTAGASAPPRLVDDLVSALRGLGPAGGHDAVAVSTRGSGPETVTFDLPKELRP